MPVPLLVALVALLAPYAGAMAQDGVLMLRYSTWGVQADPDPFKKKHPTLAYLAPGTVIFETRPAPLPGFLSVLPQFGHRVWISAQIRRPGGSGHVDVLRPIEGLLKKPPTNAIVLHESILCLGQVNRIATPPTLCRPSTPGGPPLDPVGKGWVFSFEETSKQDWVVVEPNLDNETLRQITERGWIPDLARFEITRSDLEALEKRGYLIVLDKTVPPITFEYLTQPPIYIECGQKEVTEKTLRASTTATATAKLGAEAPLWAKFITGLKGSLGLALDAETAIEGGRKWTISIDTTQESYLYYLATMTDEDPRGQGFEVQSTILVEKTFECKGSPHNVPGDRITQVRFEIEEGGSAADITEYRLTDADTYLPVPDEVLKHHPRPIFVSANTPAQYELLFANVIKRHNPDTAALAHFMVSHINNTCTAARDVRQICADAVDRELAKLVD